MRTSSSLIGIMIALSACGGDGSVSIDTNANNVCSEIAEVACHNLYQCCSEGEIENFLNIDEPRTELQCRDDVRKLCQRAIATRDFSIAEGRSTFDAQIMNTCLDAIVAPDGECAAVVDVLPWTEACMNDAWIGNVAVGAECFFAFECSGVDNFCANNQRCTALPGSGQPCTGSCASNLFCSANVCQPTLGQGGLCTSNVQCQTNLFCDFNLPTPTCATRGDGGDPCTSSNACTSGQCIPGTCAGTNNSCFADDDCNGRCADDMSFCSQDSQCAPGRCSITTTTSCSIDQQCPLNETCVFPVECLPGDCIGQPTCTANQVIVDYCTGALNELPF